MLEETCTYMPLTQHFSASQLAIGSHQQAKAFGPGIFHCVVPVVVVVVVCVCMRAHDINWRCFTKIKFLHLNQYPSNSNC